MTKASAATAALPLPRRAPALKSQRVAADLRALTGTLAPGDRLPSVAELERHFGVSTSTIEAAMESLRREGLIVRRRGSGTFIADRGTPAAPPAAASPRPPAALSGTLAVFGRGDVPFARVCIDHLISESAHKGLTVECRYTADWVGLEDVLRFEALGPAAFVMVGPWLEWAAAEMIARGHRAVVIGEPFVGETPRVLSVFADAETGGYLAAKRLLDLGHRRVAFAHGMPDEMLRRKTRWLGHCHALREAGLLAEGEEPPIIGGGEGRLHSWLADGEAVRRSCSGPDGFTGVVAWTDTTAVEVVVALRRAGLSVPDDVSIIGYDNLELSAYSFPPLDTVDQNLAALARHALNLVLAPEPPVPPPGASQRALIVPSVITRASCASPRDAA